MTLPTHAATGLLIGAIVGHPIIGLVVACAPDVDHLYSYVKHGYLKDWNTFYKNAFGKDDARGDQRNILHNVVVFGILVLLVWFLLPQLFLVFTLAYGSHLLLDAVDTSDYYLLYPWKKINIRGFIDFYSWQEAILLSGILIALIFVLI
jgi:membrane-bound metal-dependent hydrolase YbcI (DUF457 family)